MYETKQNKNVRKLLEWNVMPGVKQTKEPTHPDVVEDSLKLQRLILSLHGSGVQTITTINKLNDVTGGAAYRQVVL